MEDIYVVEAFVIGFVQLHSDKNAVTMKAKVFIAYLVYSVV